MKSMPIKYGKSLDIRRDGDIISYAERVISGSNVVQDITVMTESEKVDDDNDILKICVQMIDRQKAGEIDFIGIQCLRDGSNGAMRVKKYWIVP